jgi:hypothetical protein
MAALDESCPCTRLAKLVSDVNSINNESIYSEDRADRDAKLIDLMLMQPNLTLPRCVTPRPQFVAMCERASSHLDLRAIIASIICPSFPGSLDNLHNSDEAVNLVAEHHDLPPNHSGRTIFSKRYLSVDPLGSDRLRRALGLFVERHIRPLIIDDEATKGGRRSPETHDGNDGPTPPRLEVVYQARPTLRIQLPGQPALNVAHIDYGYKRQPTEVNVWIPLTRVVPENTLFVESHPEKGDYTPLTAEPPSFWLFYGKGCRFEHRCLFLVPARARSPTHTQKSMATHIV